MKSWVKATIEFFGAVTFLYVLLLLVTSSLPGEPSAPPPLTSAYILNFMEKCEGRTVLIDGELECRL